MWRQWSASENHRGSPFEPGSSNIPRSIQTRVLTLFLCLELCSVGHSQCTRHKSRKDTPLYDLTLTPASRIHFTTAFRVMPSDMKTPASAKFPSTLRTVTSTERSPLSFMVSFETSALPLRESDKNALRRFKSSSSSPVIRM